MALTAEYMKRTADDPITFNTDSTQTRYIYTGWGVNAQASYLFKNNFEVAFRYSVIAPDVAISHLDRQTEICEVGLTRYLNKHRSKGKLNGS